MGWQHETQLLDLPPSTRLHLTCRDCSYAFYEPLGERVTHREHRYLYVDEITKLVCCPQFGCGSQRLKIAKPFSGETEAFVGGMP